MALLTDSAWQVVLDLSRRYGVSTDAVTELLRAVSNGGGTMAQFNIWELGGGGQWMRGGMTMVGDMFNHALKAKVDGLCAELSNLLASQNPFAPPPPSGGPPQQSGWQSQQQGTGSYPQSGGYRNWWPADLGSPNGSGGQNNSRYAYFNAARRLAVEQNGRVTVYDTLDHQIGGVQQQQGGGSPLAFTSQYGTVPVENLPVVSINGVPQSSPPAGAIPAYGNAPQTVPESDVFAKIEQLAGLRQSGYISDAEFDAKKAELLGRL